MRRKNPASLRSLVDQANYDPAELTRRRYLGNLWLRDTLESAARELERMAAGSQGDTKVLLARARRVRQRLHLGVPEGVDSGALGPPPSSSLKRVAYVGGRGSKRKNHTESGSGGAFARGRPKNRSA